MSASKIVVRRIPFAFDEQIDPVWHPARPEWSHMVNGASLAMPYLEPFLIKTVTEALKQVDDPALKADVQAFIGQEGVHYQSHRRYNEILKQTYPELALTEAEMDADYRRFQKRSLKWRLAYTAGFETMTMGITEWLIRRRQPLFAGSDSAIASLVLWHMVEETEHKLVAHDVYEAVSPGYWRRAVGVLHGSLDVIRWSRRCYRALLLADGRWQRPLSRLNVWWWAARFLLGAGPAVLRALVPGHDPRDMKDHPWVREWIAGHARQETRGAPMPLIDTQSAAMPVPF